MYRFEGSVARRVLNPLLTFDSIFWLTSLGHNTKKRVADIQRFTGQVKSYDVFSQVILNKTKFLLIYSQLIKKRREVLKNETKEPEDINNNENDFHNSKTLLLNNRIQN